MQELSMVDMNSLNAIAGLLRHAGYTNAANVLISIQAKATRMLEKKSQEADK